MLWVEKGAWEPLGNGPRAKQRNKAVRQLSGGDTVKPSFISRVRTMAVLRNYRLAFRTVPAVLSVLLVAGCSSDFAFETFDNSFVNSKTGKTVYTSEQVKKEISLFAEGLNKHETNRLNTEYVSKGLRALARKDYLEANTNFQRALKFEPKNSMLHALNGLAHQLRAEAGDPEQSKMAAVGYELAARMDPGDSMVPYYMGVLHFKQQRYRLAQEYFADAVNLDSNNAEYLIGLAASSYYLGELDRAYTNIDRALSLAPDSPAVLRSGGLIYASVGDFERANISSQKLGTISRVGKRYLDRRITEWKKYYSSENIKTDPVVVKQLAQNLDAFGVPSEDEMFKTPGSGDSPVSNETQPDGPSPSAVPVTTPTTSADTPSSATTSAPTTTAITTPAVSASPAGADTTTAPAVTQVAAPKAKLPKMALVDVAIIRTEEIFKTSKGVNLLNGLNIFFTGDQFFQTKTPAGVGRVRTALTANDTITLKLGTLGAGLTYSMNIFNSNYDRNQVIARPTILVEDQKKSSFFSGGTMHIVLEGGTAGSGSMEPIDTGVKLEVTPAFLDSETLDLNVYVERTFLEAGLSQVSDTITGTSFATTSKTTISANLALRYGETMVLSGLSDQEKENLDDKTPGLGDVPGVQYLFRNQVKTSSKRTVLILLTPRRATLSYESGDPVISNDEQADSKLKKLEASTSWMRPASNLSAFVKHLGKYEYFNHYRSGDMQLENWAGEGNLNDAIIRALEYFYIFYEFDKSEESTL